MDVVPYYTFLRANATLEKAAFLTRYPAPFLYFQNLPDLELTDLFTTMRITPGVTPPDLGLQGIIHVAKDSASNAFGMMITMGRAKNNDLVIPDKRVSKFHAYFRQVGDAWMCTDANSTNGTKINGVELAAERSFQLHSGGVILLSDAIRAVFLSPDEMHQQLLEARAWVT